MSNKTQPIFIIGTGRCGTRSLFKLLSGISDDHEIYHEYLCTHIQRIACLHYMGILSEKETKKTIQNLHGTSIYYSKARYWIDCSNKLSWLIQPLKSIYPNAKFLLLTRDGRKVVASYYYKLREEIYADKDVQILQSWLANQDKQPMPPPEKRYWWNIPQRWQPFFKGFPSFNRTQRISYHWSECNRVILKDFKHIDKKKRMVAKLEEITTDENALKKVIDFINIPYYPAFFKYLQTPRNVFVPLNFRLTHKQENEFLQIAQPIMEQLNYSVKGEPYYVKY